MMMTKQSITPRAVYLVSATAASLLFSGIAAAAVGETVSLEEIIVTAQKRAEKIQDVPVAITVATQEQLERDQIYSLTDLQRITPALEVSQTAGGETTGGGRIRGIGTNVFNPSAAGSVAIVIDQVPQGNVSFPQVFDLTQVEVLRGPQGTLFGQTASAGVINMNTAAPDPTEFSAKVGFDYSDKGTAGSRFGQSVVRGSINMPTGDASAVRLSAFYKSETGLQRNVYLNRDNKITDVSFRARYLIEPSDAWKVTLTGELHRDDKDGVNFFVLAKAPTNPGSAAAQAACGLTNIKESAQEYCSARMSTTEIDNMGLSSLIEWTGDSVAFTSVTGYREKEERNPYLDFTRTVGVPSATQQRTRFDSDQLSQEFRLGSVGDNVFNYTTGVFLSRFNYKALPLENLPFGVNTLPVGFGVCTFTGTFCVVPTTFTNQKSKVSSESVFADLSYGFDNGWTVFGGLRYTHQKTELGTGINGPITNNQSVTDSNVSGRLGARWKPSESVMFYTSLARGFKGSVLEVNANPGVATVRLNPEIPLSVELGTKISLLDDRLALDMNVFHNSVKDYHAQESVLVNTQLTSVSKNISKVVSKGFEIDLIGAVGDNLSFNAGYLFNSVKYPSGFKGNDGNDIGGMQLVYSPKHKLTLSGEYAQAVGARVEAFLSVNAVYKSDLLLDARTSPAYTYPSHATLGASIGMRSPDGKWTASVFGRNLTDENEPTAYLANSFAGAPDGGVRAWPVGGLTVRQVGISMDMRF